MAFHKGSGLGGRMRLNLKVQTHPQCVVNRKTYMFEILYNEIYCTEMLRLLMWAHRISNLPGGACLQIPHPVAYHIYHHCLLFLTLPLPNNQDRSHKWTLAKLLTNYHFSLHTYNMELNKDLQRSIVSLQMKQNPCYFLYHDLYIDWKLNYALFMYITYDYTENILNKNEISRSMCFV